MVPLEAIDPLHAPEAAQEVALVADQLNVELAPGMILVGLAVKLTVGAGVLAAAVVVIVTDFVAEPPLPLQVRVNCVVAVTAAVELDPFIGCAPLQPPEAMHDVALLEVQLNVALLPLAI